MSLPIEKVTSGVKRSASVTLEGDAKRQCKGPWNGRSVSSDDSFPFMELLPELQNIIGRSCDESTRMCLYLTSKVLYDTKVDPFSLSRPRMLWSTFAKAAMLAGHVAHVRFGLELGMDPRYFSRFVVQAAIRGHQEVVCLPNVKATVPQKGIFSNLDEVFLHAGEQNSLEDYEWVKKEFPSSSWEASYWTGIVKGSHLALVSKLPINIFIHFESLWSAALGYANFETIALLKEKGVPFPARSFWVARDIGANNVQVFKNIHARGLLNLDLQECFFSACKFNNVALLNELHKIDPTLPRSPKECLRAALYHLSFEAFDWLLDCRKLKWSQDVLQQQPYFSERPLVRFGTPTDKKTDGLWLQKILEKLKKRDLAHDLMVVLYKLYPWATLDLLKMYMQAGADIDYKVLFAEAVDKRAVIELVLSLGRAAAAGEEILCCSDASHTQRSRLIDMLDEEEKRDLLVGATYSHFKLVESAVDLGVRSYESHRLQSLTFLFREKGVEWDAKTLDEFLDELLDRAWGWNVDLLIIFLTGLIQAGVQFERESVELLLSLTKDHIKILQFLQEHGLDVR